MTPRERMELRDLNLVEIGYKLQRSCLNSDKTAIMYIMGEMVRRQEEQEKLEEQMKACECFDNKEVLTGVI